MKSNRFLRLYIIYLLPTLLIILVLGGGSTIISRYLVNRNLEDNARSELKQITTYYETVLDEMNSLALQFSSNSDILQRFRAITISRDIGYNEYRESRLFDSYINSAVNSHPYINAIYIYIENPQDLAFRSSNGFIKKEFIEHYDSFADYMASQHENESISMAFDDIIRILRPITSSTGSQIGVIMLDLKKDYLINAISDMGPTRLEVTTIDGPLLFANWERSGKHDMKTFTETNTSHNWIYTLSYPKDELYYISNSLLIYTLLLTAICVLLALIFSIRAHKKEIRFLKGLMTKFNQKPDRDDLENYRDVYDYVNYNIVQTFIEGDYLKWQKEMAEMRALQLQLNPHFLFNTLETINWKAIRLSEGDNEVSRMIQILSRLLQYALRSDLNGVDLDEELEQSRRYLQIQRYRFPERFEYTENIDEDLLDAQVPSLFLEPLLENIFTHAFQGRKLVHALLTIRKLDEHRMEIRLVNDGKQLSDEEIERLNRTEDDILIKKKSLGIANTRKRLSLFYQGNSSLVIASRSEGGLEVVITLPIIRTEQSISG